MKMFQAPENPYQTPKSADGVEKVGLICHVARPYDAPTNGAQKTLSRKHHRGRMQRLPISIQRVNGNSTADPVAADR
jgi:hypothetical protein